MNTNNEQLIDTLGTHLEELRSVLIRCLLIIAVSLGCTFIFYHDIFSLITRPLQHTQGSALTQAEIQVERIQNNSAAKQKFTLPAGTHLLRKSANVQEINSITYDLLPGEHLDIEKTKALNQLVILGPVDGLTTCVKVCFWVAVVASSPFWLYNVLLFILPGLTNTEKRLLGPFIGLSAVFLCGGCVFAYFVTLPLSSAVLWAFNHELGSNLWSLSSYLDFTLFILLANALAFELSLVLFFLVHLQVITPESMSTYRRHVLVAILVLSALLTPPDVLSQLFLAVPLAALYETAIVYARFKKNQRQSLKGL